MARNKRSYCARLDMLLLVNTKHLLLILAPAMTPLLPPRTRGQRRQREEEVDKVSTLSKHDSREFNDIIAAYKDPYYQIGIP